MFRVFMFHLSPMPHAVKLALLVFVALAVYLVGNDRVALWDRDEPRNAQASRQMLQSGDWVVPRFLDKIRTAKPPFTYWMQGTAMRVLGDNTFAARLPSAVAMALTLVVLGGVLTRYVDRDRAFWTVFVLATSAIVIAWTARTSLTDAILLLWTTIAQLGLFAILRGRGSWPVVITTAVAIGLAGLTKGPVVLGVMGMTLLAWAILSGWDRRRGWGASDTSTPPVRAISVIAKTVVVVGIILVIVGPWLRLVEQRAPGFVGTSVAHDVVRRTMEPLEQHKGPPGYYALVAWGIYFPWSVLLPLTFVVAWRHRSDPRVRFALAAVIGPWVMLELVQTKLPHYLLPIFPPLAFLTADAIVRCLRGEHGDLVTKGTRGAIAVWGLIVVALGVVPWLALGKFRHLPIAPMVAFTALTVAYPLIVFIFFRRGRPDAGLVAMGLGMILAMTIAFGWYLPNAHFLRLTACVADVLKQNGGGARDTQPGDVQMIAFKEPSLAFHQGGTIREQPETEFLLTHPPSEWPKWLVIRDDVWQRMPADVKDRLEVVGSCRGVAYAAGGKTWTVWVVRKR
jgi:4-amino-4-deoxy-L-arabinose transferase-like glycosyltransferase